MHNKAWKKDNSWVCKPWIEFGSCVFECCLSTFVYTFSLHEQKLLRNSFIYKAYHKINCGKNWKWFVPLKMLDFSNWIALPGGLRITKLRHTYVEKWTLFPSISSLEVTFKYKYVYYCLYFLLWLCPYNMDVCV